MARPDPLAVRNELGTGIHPSDFLIGCAPAHEPRAYPRRVGNFDRCHPGRDHNRGFASHCHTTTVGGAARPAQGTNVTTHAWLGRGRLAQSEPDTARVWPDGAAGTKGPSHTRRLAQAW